MTRGRPALGVSVVQIHLTLCLHAGQDDDLIWYFSHLPLRRRAAAVKSALRTGGISQEPDIKTIDDDSDGFENLLWG